MKAERARLKNAAVEAIRCCQAQTIGMNSHRGGGVASEAEAYRLRIEAALSQRFHGKDGGGGFQRSEGCMRQAPNVSPGKFAS
jgi:hypothetical protein